MTNKLHERVLKIVLNDQTRIFETLLAVRTDICSYRHIRILKTEI